MSTVTLNATSDAYTNQANSTTNYGTATDLRVGNDGTAAGTYDSFVTFDLSTLTSNLGAAYLTLHGAQTSAQTGLKVYDVTTNPSETGVTWATQPSPDQLQSVTAVGTTSGDYRFDVLPYLQYAKANSIGTVTFMLVQDTTNGTPSGYADFSSREGATAPTLVAYTSDMAEAPTADAYIDDSNPSTNYGSDTTLLVGNGYGENSCGLLGFDLTGVQGTPTHAYLHVWADALIGQNIGIAVKPVTGSWTESAVTWNNQPSIGSGSQYVIVGDGLLREYTLDVSDLVTAAMGSSATHVDFELQETSVTGVTSGPYIEFNSREASSNTPSLVFSGVPTIATPAAATLNSQQDAAVLSVLGGDPSGEQNLTYTWTATSTPAGANVTFYDNGDNSAKVTPIGFDTAGNYAFQVTASDGTNSVTSSVTMTVNQVVTSILAAPGGAAVYDGTSQSLSATAYDQFGTALVAQPTFSWSATSGSFSGSTYSAPSVGAGPDTVTASAGGVSANATVEYGGIVGNVFEDDNDDAAFEAGEPGAGGFQVYLDTNGNHTEDVGEPATSSDDNGNFAFNASFGGCQLIQLISRAGWSSTLATAVATSPTTTPVKVGAAAQARTLAISTSPASTHIGQTVTVTVTLTDTATGAPIDGQDVTLQVSNPSGTVRAAELKSPDRVATKNGGKAVFTLRTKQVTAAGAPVVLTAKANQANDTSANMAVAGVSLSITAPAPAVGAVNSALTLFVNPALGPQSGSVTVTAIDPITKAPVPGVFVSAIDPKNLVTDPPSIATNAGGTATFTLSLPAQGAKAGTSTFPFSITGALTPSNTTNKLELTVK